MKRLILISLVFLIQFGCSSPVYFASSTLVTLEGEELTTEFCRPRRELFHVTAELNDLSQEQESLLQELNDLMEEMARHTITRSGQKWFLEFNILSEEHNSLVIEYNDLIRKNSQLQEVEEKIDFVKEAGQLLEERIEMTEKQLHLAEKALRSGKKTSSSRLNPLIQLYRKDTKLRRDREERAKLSAERNRLFADFCTLKIEGFDLTPAEDTLNAERNHLLSEYNTVMKDLNTVVFEYNDLNSKSGFHNLFGNNGKHSLLREKIDLTEELNEITEELIALEKKMIAITKQILDSMTRNQETIA